jgi:hypothetical protein
MRVPRVRFRLWMAMVTVAVSGGVMAEIGQRRERLARLCIGYHERADACFDQTGRICKLGETPASIEAFYRRQGPTVWLDYQKGLYHLTLANQYDQAANRPWLPMLSELPPIGCFMDIRTLAQWGLEALLEATPLFGTLMLVLTLSAATATEASRSAECHEQDLIRVTLPDRSSSGESN